MQNDADSSTPKITFALVYPGLLAVHFEPDVERSRINEFVLDSLSFEN